jgi:hypothetical protein
VAHDEQLESVQRPIALSQIVCRRLKVFKQNLCSDHSAKANSAL